MEESKEKQYIKAMQQILNDAFNEFFEEVENLEMEEQHIFFDNFYNSEV